MEEAGEQTARERAYKAAWQRARRAERKAAGRCKDCGTPCDDLAALKGFCGACSQKIRRQDAAKREVEQARREEARQVAALAPGAPFCPHCGGSDLMRGGTANGKKRFKCRGCQRWSYGEAPPVKPTLYPCPYCSGRCQKKERDEKGRQRYLCTGCGRRNTDLYPQTPRATDGPFPYVMSFYLDIPAHQNLVAYCNATGMAVAPAVRTILRQAAGAKMAAGRWSVCPAPEVSALAYVRLPDLRSQVTRARMQRTERLKYLPSVYGVMSISVALDALARQGLVRTALVLGKTHQEAARYLLAGTRPPDHAKSVLLNGVERQAGRVRKQRGRRCSGYVAVLPHP
jgi:transposase-like protein